jgi:Protein of unknown function (DUF3515)
MRGAVACALLVLLAGCGGGPVDVAGPAPSAADAEACAPFLDELPDEVAGEERREVDPDDRSFAAWGDPAIVLACGVPMPSGYQPGATCMRADDVDWYIPDTQLDDEDERADITMTAVGFTPVVTVDVPGDYRPEGLAAAMSEIGEVVSATLTAGEPCATE